MTQGQAWWTLFINRVRELVASGQTDKQLIDKDAVAYADENYMQYANSIRAPQ